MPAVSSRDTLDRMSVPAIIFAAGASRRLGQPKQLLHVHGETLVARNVRIAHEAGASPVFVVLGAEREDICAALEGSGATLVDNPQWQSGLSSSVRAGVAAVEAQLQSAAGVLLMNCDQPRLDTSQLRTLLATFKTADREAIVASSYAGVHGVPAVFPARLFTDLKTLAGDKGARSLFTRNAESLIAVSFEGGEIDIDTPDDLAHLT